MNKAHALCVIVAVLLLCAFNGDINGDDGWLRDKAAALDISKLCLILGYIFAHVMTMVPRKLINKLPGFVQVILHAIGANYYHSHDYDRPKKW